MSSKYQTITLSPLIGPFDARSSADQKPPGSFAWKEAYAINADGKLARAKGWQRPFPTGLCPYRNHDWHDQGVAVASREPITLLSSVTKNDWARSLFLATKTRIRLLNESAGSWSAIADGLGADGSGSNTQTRFNSAVLQNKVVFTNNLDRVKYYDLDTLAFANVPSLNTAGEPGFVDVSKAKRVISWNGLVFLLNTVEGGVRFSSRIRWSDLNLPLSWIPASGSSLADYQDLDYGENILNAVPMAGSLYVFTDKSIWRCTIETDFGVTEAKLICVKVYTEPRNQAKCLVYPNTLVSTGLSIFYLGRDGWYEYNPYIPEPERPEWLHRSTSVIFSDAATLIDKTACESPVSEYHPETNELHLSWPTYQVIAVEAEGGAGELDCDAVSSGPSVGTGLNNYTLVANIKYKTSDIRLYGSSALVNHRSDVLAQGDCNQAILFLAGNGEDFTIKQLNVGYGREMYDPIEDTYSMVGYVSLLRGIFPFTAFDKEKLINSFLADVIADDPADTAVLRLKIGTSATAIDPNRVSTESNRCGVIWRQLSSIPIKCAYTKTAAQYASANVRANPPSVEWSFFDRGRFLIYELTLTDIDGGLPVTGGHSLSRFEVEARLV